MEEDESMKPHETAHIGLLFGIFLVLAPLSHAFNVGNTKLAKIRRMI
jgi:hypothetical protein